MQTRVLSCLAGGFLGAAAGYQITDYSFIASLGLSAAIVMIGCAAAGVAAGYGVSFLIDVFTAEAQ